MLTYKEALQLTEEGIKEIELGNEPVMLYEPIRYVLGMGGKRIRPVLTLMSSSLFGGDYRQSLPAALALELFHNFTLMHDDIMDNAPLRRSYQTVHVKWSQNIAILSGDAMLIKAYEMLALLPEEIFLQAIRIFNKTALEVCEGQQMDMDFEKQEKVSVEQYLEMIRRKTSVLLAACMKIGACAGGAAAYEAELLYQAGINIGLAFQLQDDLLDTFGEQETFGKEIGGDIRSNKKTFLYIKSLDLATSADQEILKKYYSYQSSDALSVEEKVATVTALFRKYQVDRITTELIRSFADQAIAKLNELSVEPHGKEELIKLFVRLLERKN